MADHARQAEPAVGPRRRQIGAEHRISQKHHRHNRHDRAGGAARGFEHQQDEDAAKDHVPAVRHRGAIHEVVAAVQRVANDADAGDGRDHVEPLNAIAEAAGEREQQEAQQQHEGDVDVAQLLGRDDVVGGVEMEQRHDDGDAGDQHPRQAGEPIAGALFLLDVFFGLAQAFRRNRGIRLQSLSHRFPRGAFVRCPSCYRPDLSGPRRPPQRALPAR